MTDLCQLPVTDLSDHGPEGRRQGDILAGIVQNIQVGKDRAHLDRVKVTRAGIRPVRDPVLVKDPGKGLRPPCRTAQKNRDIPVLNGPRELLLLVPDHHLSDHATDWHKYPSELHTEHEADTVLVDTRVVFVRQTANILYVEEFEDVVQTKSEFHVRLVLIHDHGVLLIILLAF